METTKKAFGYVRVSGKSQVDGDGPVRQRAAIKDYAVKHGIRIVAWYSDDGVSGTLEHREQLDKMLVDLMANGTRTVVIERLDRLSRDLRVQENLIHQYFTNRFELISTAEPDLGSSDPSRVFVRQIFGAVAQLDKSNIVLKLKAARQRKRAATGKCEGRKNYGQHEGEAAILERIISLHASGSNYEAIAKALNADGVKTRSGGIWYPATVRKILLKANPQAA